MLCSYSSVVNTFSFVQIKKNLDVKGDRIVLRKSWFTDICQPNGAVLKRIIDGGGFSRKSSRVNGRVLCAVTILHRQMDDDMVDWLRRGIYFFY